MGIEVVKADTYPHVRFVFSFFHVTNGQSSAHADLNENFMAVTNLDDGVDLYSVPTMQLIKTYLHGNVNNAIFKVSFVDNNWLVSGGQDGFARLYDWRSGQFLQRLDHSSGMCSVGLCAILEPHNEFQMED